MASSTTPFETAPLAWAKLTRLRDLSRLILAAATEDDIEAVERFSAESEAMIEALRNDLDAGSAPAEAKELLAEVTAMHRRISNELEERLLATAKELAALRSHRHHLRTLRLHGTDCGPARIDRRS
jgi:cysteinyl-tRNA synthetase